MLDNPGDNGSIADHENIGIDRLGIQAESPEELNELRAGIDRVGGPVENEGETTCCYARAKKTWVVDAQSVAWEVFYTSGEVEPYYENDTSGCYTA